MPFVTISLLTTLFYLSRLQYACLPLPSAPCAIFTYAACLQRDRHVDALRLFTFGCPPQDDHY